MKRTRERIVVISGQKANLLTIQMSQNGLCTAFMKVVAKFTTQWRPYFRPGYEHCHLFLLQLWVPRIYSYVPLDTKEKYQVKIDPNNQILDEVGRLALWRQEMSLQGTSNWAGIWKANNANWNFEIGVYVFFLLGFVVRIKRELPVPVSQWLPHSPGVSGARVYKPRLNRFELRWWRAIAPCVRSGHVIKRGRDGESTRRRMH